MLAPHEAAFFFRAECVKGAERETFEYYLATNDTAEARDDILNEGWTILGASCVPTKGKTVNSTAVSQRLRDALSLKTVTED